MLFCLNRIGRDYILSHLTWSKNLTLPYNPQLAEMPKPNPGLEDFLTMLPFGGSY